jgi:hypothetical protein
MSTTSDPQEKLQAIAFALGIAPEELQPHGAHVSGDARTRQALELLKGFSHIEGDNARQLVLWLVNSLATEERSGRL